MKTKVKTNLKRVANDRNTHDIQFQEEKRS